MSKTSQECADASDHTYYQLLKVDRGITWVRSQQIITSTQSAFAKFKEYSRTEGTLTMKEQSTLEGKKDLDFGYFILKGRNVGSDGIFLIIEKVPTLDDVFSNNVLCFRPLLGNTNRQMIKL
jgi:hypothetical protein